MRSTQVLYLVLAIVAYAAVAERWPGMARFVPYTLLALMPLLFHLRGRTREGTGRPAARQCHSEREAETR